jgi:hypothetical protein
MLRLLALLTLLLTTADHWTTWLCLHAPVPGWNVSEANPAASWLFESTGLLPGLLIDSAITLAAVAFLVTTRALPRRAKLGFLGVISLCTGYAVLNNAIAIHDMGLMSAGVA